MAVSLAEISQNNEDANTLGKQYILTKGMNGFSAGLKLLAFTGVEIATYKV